MKRVFTQKQSLMCHEGTLKKYYGRLILLAAIVMMAGSAKAQSEYNTPVDYNFGSGAQITMTSESYPRPASYPSNNHWNALVVGGTLGTQDISKFAFRPSGNYSWMNRNYGGLSGSNEATLVIRGLRGGDRVTITYSGSNLNYVRNDGNVHAIYADRQIINQDASGQYDFYQATGDFAIRSGQEIHITSDGDMVLRSAGNYCTITNIRIQTLKYCTYTITRNYNNNPQLTRFEFTGVGLMDYNDIAVPYMQVSFGGTHNFVVVKNDNGYKSYIYDGQEYEGVYIQNVTNDNQQYREPYSGNYYAFTPTGNGHVILNGSTNGTVHLYKWNESEGRNMWNGGSLYWGTWYNGTSTIEFDVESGYTYYLREDYPNTWGQNFHLQALTFRNDFYLDNLAKVTDSNGGILTTVHGSSNLQKIDNKSYVKRYSDNIDISNLNVSLDNSGQLSVSGIQFAKSETDANPGGTIIYHLETNEGKADYVITIPYKADWGTDEEKSYGTRTWGHRWDFSNPGARSDSKITKCYIRQDNGTYALGTTNNPDRLSIGRAGDASQLQEEIDKREWNYAQRVTGQSGGFHDPMYTNVFDMEGDNADMLWETEGLWFDTESNLSCLWNQTASTNYRSSVDPDRYIGLLPPSTANGISSFTIPGLKDGDRVEIFLGSGEGSGQDIPYFTITGAKDALGTPITSEYGFGGSMWDVSGGSYDYRACYQFIKDGDGLMKFALTHGSMAKLYSIRIYRGEKSYQNNVIRNRQNIDGYQVLNTYKDGAVGDDGKQYWYQLHYRGKGESLYGQPEVLASTGNLDYSRLWYEQSGHLVKFQTKIGDYGSFRMRLKCADFGGHYVADYADQTISVGYLEKMQYPYTWDFTDLKSWIDSDAQNDGMLKELWHASQTDDNKWLNIWSSFDAGTENEAYGLTVNHNSDRNVTRDQIRSNGGQLYAGNIMINETRGLGIETFNAKDEDSYDKNLNDRMKIMKDGLNISGLTENKWTFNIPEVDNNATVYVRVKKLGSPDANHAECFKCRFARGAEQDYAKTIEIANDETGESVFIVKNTTGSAQDMRLVFNQVKVKRIAVATDEKKVNVKGYTSESRNHAIDASLLPYFTGEDMRTYMVSNPDYDKLTLTLTDVAPTEAYVIPANTGCIIRRLADGDDKKFDILGADEGFHLFVPDMHDQTGKFADVTTNNQFMVAAVAGMESGVPSSSSVTYNYVTLKHDGANLNNDGAVFFAYTWDDNGHQWIPETDGKIYGLQQGGNVIFVRMNPAYKDNPSWDGKWNQTANLTVQLGTICELSFSDSNLIADWQSDPTAQNVDMTNYVLTYKYYKVKNDGSVDGPFEGEEKFYRVYSKQTIKLHPNSAYLQLPNASVMPEGAGNRAHAFTFVFEDGEQQTTGIDNLNVEEQGAELFIGEDAEWYNLNGQKLNGRPTLRGLYIVNGKKVMVK